VVGRADTLTSGTSICNAFVSYLLRRHGIHNFKVVPAVRLPGEYATTVTRRRSHRGNVFIAALARALETAARRPRIPEKVTVFSGAQGAIKRVASEEPGPGQM